MTQELWNQEELENIFRERGINFEVNSRYYLGEIEGRKFHYSPKTQKWKIKGEQRTWLISKDVEDFITQAQKYSPSKSKSKEQKSHVSTHFARKEQVEPTAQNSSVHERNMSFFEVKSKQLAEAVLEVAGTTRYPDKLMSLAIVQLDNLPNRFTLPSEQVPIYLASLRDIKLRELLAEINLSAMVFASIVHQTSELIWQEIIQYDKIHGLYQLKEPYPPGILEKIISLEDVPKVERIIDHELTKRRALAQDIFPCNSKINRSPQKMTTNQIKLLDVVALTVALPEHNLSRGQVGTIVEILDDGAAFLVEFSGDDGQSSAFLPLSPNQLLVLHFEQA